MDAWNRTKWSFGTAALYFVLAVLPTGGFFAERKLRREEQAGVEAGRAQVAGGESVAAQ